MVRTLEGLSFLCNLAAAKDPRKPLTTAAVNGLLLHHAFQGVAL